MKEKPEVDQEAAHVPVKGLTIVFKADTPEDAQKHIVEAISGIQWVESVTTSVITDDDHYNRQLIKKDIVKQITDLLAD